MNEFETMMRSPLARRAFLTRMSAAGLGVAATALLNGCGGSNNSGPGVPTATPNPTGTGAGGVGVFDAVNFPTIIGRNINETVLNFALTLEILEADLYRQALNKASGKALNAPLTNESDYSLSVAVGNISPSSGQPAADAFLFLRQFTFVEAAHRDFLTAAIRSLGGTPQPANPGGYRFLTGGGNPGNDLKTILGNLLPLEETGVRAYLGAAGFLTDLGLLQTAGTIFSTEARHSAVVSDALGIDPGPNKKPGDKQVVTDQPSEKTFEYFLDPPTVITAVSAYFVR